MGSGGKKETNRQLSAQAGLQNQYANQMGGRGESEYNYRSGLRDTITNEYLKAMQNAPTVAGGSAGTPDWWGPAADFYKNLMETGGWSPEEMANYRSWTTAPISGFYTGLKNQLQRQNAAIGGSVGYNSQTAKLARDAARQGFQTAQESESGLQQMIREAKERGAAGYQSSYHKGSGGSAGYAGAPGSKDYYLRQLTGLMGGAEDLPYSELQGGGLRSAAGTIGSRVDETPGWQKALMGVIPSAAGAAMSVFGGGDRRPKAGDIH